MTSPTQRALTSAEVVAHLQEAFGTDTEVRNCAPLAGGGFAAVWSAEIGDPARSVVLKVGPPPGVPLLRYETGLIAAEAEYFRLVRAAGVGVPVPEVLYQGNGWIVTQRLPGTALPGWAGPDAPVRFELGAALARLHTVTGPRFGYTGDRAHGDTWSAAYLSMMDDLLLDAADWQVELPVSPGDIRAALVAEAALLDQVDRPALLHFDLWDGNVLAGTDPDGTARLTGLVDGERYLFGDPLFDFVSPALYRRIEDPPEHPFLAGYRSVSPVALGTDERRRLACYRLHFMVLMLAEMPSRGMTGPEGDQRRGTVAALILAQLADLG